MIITFVWGAKGTEGLGCVARRLIWEIIDKKEGLKKVISLCPMQLQHLKVRPELFSRQKTVEKTAIEVILR